MKKLTLLLLIIPLLTIDNMMAQRFVIQQKCEVYRVFEKTGTQNGYAYVDLGLPSGLKWATCNVGAAHPWDYGDYFAWGETVGYGKEDRSNAHNYAYTGYTSYVKTYYYWDAYKYCSGDYNTLTKYCNNSSYGNNGYTDTKTVLDPEDDAAHVNMGGSWRMPTIEEQRELMGNCYWEWTDRYNSKGVSGYIVYKVKDASDKGKKKYRGGATTTVGSYSLSDAHIFLPAAGCPAAVRPDESGLHDAGYWSSSLYAGFPYGAYYLYFSVSWSSDYRGYGLSVRGVCE